MKAIDFANAVTDFWPNHKLWPEMVVLLMIGPLSLIEEAEFRELLRAERRLRPKSRGPRWDRIVARYRAKRSASESATHIKRWFRQVEAEAVAAVERLSTVWTALNEFKAQAGPVWFGEYLEPDIATIEAIRKALKWLEEPVI